MTRFIMFAYCISLILLQAEAHDITSIRQDTLKTGNQSSRFMLRLDKYDHGKLTARLASTDQRYCSNTMPVTELTVQDSNIKLNIEIAQGTFEGKNDAPGNSIRGVLTWDQPFPLQFQCPTNENVWRDPSPNTIVNLLSIPVILWVSTVYSKQVISPAWKTTCYLPK